MNSNFRYLSIVLNYDVKETNTIFPVKKEHENVPTKVYSKYCSFKQHTLKSKHEIRSVSS